ncbi:MAG: hypothetical protein B7X08_05150 [Acidocella sp. 20-63-7]|nr:MAG: hypothetical protein B7X08_05150 [Acidocella sp. 20-63-7]HQT46796.1 DUF934 domain-containing protein [Acidocella sp.]
MAVVDTQGRQIADSWIYPEAQSPLGPQVIVPFVALPEGELPQPVGVLLPPDAQLEKLATRLDEIALIAIEFPKFREGRGFTLARNLRERYGYKGDIRAVGHFVPDQFVALIRCGFSSIRTPAQHPPAQWRLPQSAAPENTAHPGQLLHRLVRRIGA